MESLNQTVGNAVSFISIVQHACNKKQHDLEETYNQKFNLYLKECKQAQKEKQILEQKKILQQEVQKVNNDDLKKSENEEIALADAMLQKARLLKQKFKLSPDGDIQDISPCSSMSNTTARNKATKTVNGQEKTTPKHTTSKMVQSKSVAVFNHCKKPTLPHSKSDSLANNGSRYGKNSIKELQKSSFLKKQSSVITQKELDSVRKKIVPKMKDEEKQAAKVSSTSIKHSNSLVSGEQTYGCLTSMTDFSMKKKCILEYETGCSEVLPTSRQFQDTFKTIDISQVKNQKHFLKSRIWYPFLSSENENHLYHRIKIKPCDDLDRICVLLHSIQEAMVWLDTFSLIGTDLIPILKALDENNVDHVLICSYLQSIFHKHFQRIPVLAPD